MANIQLLKGYSLEAAQQVATILLKKGFATWLVGGAVRDYLAGYKPHDLDLCTTAKIKEIEDVFEQVEDIKGIHFHVLPLVVQFGTLRILAIFPKPSNQAVTLDISTLRRNLKRKGRFCKVKYTTDLALDLRRRDFTINAMAIELPIEGQDFSIIDPYGGQRDLQQGLIRTVGNPRQRFKEDYLRILRGCRFTGYYQGLTIEDKTWYAMQDLSPVVVNLPKERIQMELFKILKLDKPSICLETMLHAGVLRYVVPPLAACRGIPQNKYHKEDVYQHSVLTCDAAPKDKPKLRLAALLHDIGKPATMERDTQGQIHFFNHEIAGAALAYKYLREFKFSRQTAGYVSLLIRHHMFYFTSKTKKSTIRRWLSKLKGYHQDVIQLRTADRIGNLAKAGKPPVTEHMKRLLQIIDEIENAKEPLSINDLAFSGDILRSWGLNPGPVFGRIKKHLLRLVLENPELNQKDKLIELAKEYCQKHNLLAKVE